MNAAQAQAFLLRIKNKRLRGIQVDLFKQVFALISKAWLFQLSHCYRPCESKRIALAEEGNPCLLCYYGLKELLPGFIRVKTIQKFVQQSA
jgi:hypothetical protein